VGGTTQVKRFGKIKLSFGSSSSIPPAIKFPFCGAENLNNPRWVLVELSSIVTDFLYYLKY